MCGRMSDFSFLFLASRQQLWYNGPPFSSPGAGYVIAPIPDTWTPLYYKKSPYDVSPCFATTPIKYTRNLMKLKLLLRKVSI